MQVLPSAPSTLSKGTLPICMSPHVSPMITHNHVAAHDCPWAVYTH